MYILCSSSKKFAPKLCKSAYHNSVNNNRITYNDPNILQGAVRWSNGDARDDLHNIFNPIKKAAEWYDLNDENISTIVRYSIRGLEKLKLSYNPHSVINHSIQYYINFSLFNKKNFFLNNEI